MESNHWTFIYVNLNFIWLKWQKNLNFTSEFITLRAIFFCLEFYHLDFSRCAGDFSFKLAASSKILVAMATKVVATWRVARVLDTSTWKIKLLGDPCWCYDLPIWGSIGKVSPWEGERYSSLEIEIIYHNNIIIISLFPRCSLT